MKDSDNSVKEITERFIECVKSLDVPQKEVAMGCGVSKQRISNIMSGNENVSPRILIKFISSFRGINLEYLIIGDEKIKEVKRGDRQEEMELLKKRVEDLEQIRELLLHRIESLTENIAEMKKNDEEKDQ